MLMTYTGQIVSSEMPGDAYTYTGGVDCTIPADKAQCKGKSIIVTGGMSNHFVCLGLKLEMKSKMLNIHRTTDLIRRTGHWRGVCS